MAKIALGILVAVVCTIVAAKLAYDASVHAGPLAVNEPWAQNKMEFVTWNGNKWTAWVHDGAFEHRPQHEGTWHAHSKSTLSFLDWEGNPAKATIDDEVFVVVPYGGATSHEAAIRYRDWNGESRIRTFNQLQR